MCSLQKVETPSTFTSLREQLHRLNKLRSFLQNLVARRLSGLMSIIAFFSFALQDFVVNEDVGKMDVVIRMIPAFAEKDILVTFVKRHVRISTVIYRPMSRILAFDSLEMTDIKCEHLCPISVLKSQTKIT